MSQKNASPFWRKTLYALPNASHLSWWTGIPYRWLRHGASWTLKKVGLALVKTRALQAGGELLKKAGDVLFKEGFKKLITKGVGYIAGALFGLGTGGVTTVISITSAAITAGTTVLKIAFSPAPQYKAIRETIKKLIKPITELASAVIIWLVNLAKIYPLAFGLGGAADT